MVPYQSYVAFYLLLMVMVATRRPRFWTCSGLSALLSVVARSPSRMVIQKLQVVVIIEDLSVQVLFNNFLCEFFDGPAFKVQWINLHAFGFLVSTTASKTARSPSANR